MTGLNAREEWGIHSFTSGIYHRVFQERYYNPLRLLLAFFCRLSLNMWFLTLVMIRGLVGATYDKVEGHSEIQMEA